VNLVWTFRSIGLFREVTSRMDLAVGSEIFNVQKFCTGLECDLSGVTNSRPNVQEIVKKFVENIEKSESVAVLVCGPESLGNEVLRVCRNSRMDVHVESFCL
jgi:hypothetical protein